MSRIGSETSCWSSLNMAIEDEEEEEAGVMVVTVTATIVEAGVGVGVGVGAGVDQETAEIGALTNLERLHGTPGISKITRYVLTDIHLGWAVVMMALGIDPCQRCSLILVFFCFPWRNRMILG